MPPSSAWKKAARDIALFSKPKTGLEKSLKKSEAGKLNSLRDGKPEMLGSTGNGMGSGPRAACSWLPECHTGRRNKVLDQFFRLRAAVNQSTWGADDFGAGRGPR